jgi:hypothetical protein
MTIQVRHTVASGKMNIDEPILESSSLSAKSNNPLSFAAMALSCAADILLLKHIERAGPKLTALRRSRMSLTCRDTDRMSASRSMESP